MRSRRRHPAAILRGHPAAILRALPAAVLSAALLAATATAVPAAAVPAARAPAAPRVTARTAVLVDDASGAVLWQKDGHRPVLVASTTKILTALVADGAYAPDQVFTVPVAAERVDGTRLGYKHGMRVRRHDLLEALLLMSANDAAETLAAAYPHGGRGGFIRAMQAEADNLGCTDSTWRDPTGLDVPGHLASAADLAILGRALLRRPELAAIVRQRVAGYRWPDGHVQILNNHNHLVGFGHDPGAIGIKTGYTVHAKETIVAAERRGRRVLIAVALGSAPTALYNDVRAMFAYGWATRPAPGAELLGPRRVQQPSAQPGGVPGGAIGLGASAVRTTSRPPGSLLSRMTRRAASRPLPAAVAALASLLVLAGTLLAYRAARRRQASAV